MMEQIQRTVHGAGRDAGKTFLVGEMPPIEMAGFMLRLASALRVPSYEDLFGKLADLRSLASSADAAKNGGAALDVVMKLVQGCDAAALQLLIRDILECVQVSPDPKHPAAVRALIDGDFREKKTLWDILAAFAQLNAGGGV